MKKLILFIFLAMLQLSVQAQQVNMDVFKSMKARSIGPGAMSGRITAIDAVHDDPTTIYAGSASGGLWKSTSGGITWEPIFDNEKGAFYRSHFHLSEKSKHHLGRYWRRKPKKLLEHGLWGI